MVARLIQFIHEMQILFFSDDSVKYSWLIPDKFSPTFASAPCAQGTSDFSGVAIVATNGHQLSLEGAAADALLPLDEKTKGHGKDSHGPRTLTRIEDRAQYHSQDLTPAHHQNHPAAPESPLNLKLLSQAARHPRLIPISSQIVAYTKTIDHSLALLRQIPHHFRLLLQLSLVNPGPPSAPK